MAMNLQLLGAGLGLGLSADLDAAIAAWRLRPFSRSRGDLW